MTKQEYLDLLLTTSRSGGFPALLTVDRCGYRTPDGKKCVVGLLIPDEKYVNEMEGNNVISLFYKFLCVANIIPEGLTVRSLVEIQEIHDDLACFHSWRHQSFKNKLQRSGFFDDCVFGD